MIKPAFEGSVALPGGQKVKHKVSWVRTVSDDDLRSAEVAGLFWGGQPLSYKCKKYTRPGAHSLPKHLSEQVCLYLPFKRQIQQTGCWHSNSPQASTREPERERES